MEPVIGKIVRVVADCLGKTPSLEFVLPMPSQKRQMLGDKPLDSDTGRIQP